MKMISNKINEILSINNYIFNNVCSNGNSLIYSNKFDVYIYIKNNDIFCYRI